MTPGEQTRKEDDAQPTKSTSTDDQTPSSSTKDPTKPALTNYKFKFAPADPKNSFDFEDTADK